MRKKIKRKNRHFVYMLECKDGSYYTGYTNNIEKRIKEHNSGQGKGAKYTRYRRPVELVWRKEYRYLKKAMQKEIEIKKLRRYQKEKLINE